VFLLYFFDSQSIALLRQLNWDGAIPLSSGDYIMVVENNLHNTRQRKAISCHLRRGFYYRVSLKPEGDAQATLELQYHNPTRDPYYAYFMVYTPPKTVLYENPFFPLPIGSLYCSIAPLITTLLPPPFERRSIRRS